MEFIKWWLSLLDTYWYITLTLVSPFAIMWVFYLCPPFIAFVMLIVILFSVGKTRLSWRLYNADKNDREMHNIAIGNTVKTTFLVSACVASMWLAVVATIRLGDAEGDKLCDHPEKLMWFTMPSIVLHFYTPTCGPAKPSILDEEPSDVVFGKYPKQ